MQPGSQPGIDVALDMSLGEVRVEVARLIQDSRLEDAQLLLAQGRRSFPDDVHLLLDQALLAEATDDWGGAIELLEAAMDRSPETEAAYLHASGLYRKIDRLQAAEMILVEGMCRFPSNIEMFAGYAAIAEARDDWKQVARRYRLASEKFPKAGWLHARLAAALKRMKRLQDAEQALLHGQRQVPNEPQLMIEFAEIAAEREDWIEAARRFETAREALPQDWWVLKRTADTLRRAGSIADAEALLHDGQRRFPQEPRLALDYAEFSFDRADWAETLQRFATVKDRFPGEWWPCKRIADALKSTGRTDEAEAELLDGQKRFPEERTLFVDHAEIAAEAGDWTEMTRRFEIVRDRFPDFWWSCKRIADALQAAGRTDEAETVLLDSQRRHPKEPGVFLDYAELAAARKDWPETLRRFEVVHDQFPGMWWPLRRLAQTLREMERFDEAERVIQRGMELFPDDPAMFFDHADLNQWTGRTDVALASYRLIRERFPDSFWGYFLLARSLAAAGRFGEAESMLLETIAAFPDEPGPLIELIHMTVRISADVRQVPLAALGKMVTSWIQKRGETEDLLLAQAQLAELDGDYKGCMRSLLHLAQVHPDARFVSEKIAGVREILLGRGETVPGGVGIVVPPHDMDDIPRTRQDLLNRFESLGGGGPVASTHYGCEFGFVQRHIGLEPLGLLRWAGVSLQNVTRLLANDFEGVGNVETSVLNGVEEVYDWRYVDTAYGLYCDHTHLDRLTVTQQDALQMMCQRTSFLARKLREDLEDGEKIFVYRYSGVLEDMTDVLALADAVNSFGKTMVLFVCRADEHHAPLSVHLVHSGLMIGYIDWFALDRIGYPVNLDGWSTLCDEAFRLWRSV